MCTFIPDGNFIGALAFDLGSVTTRAGYAGEDMPQVYPSALCAWTTPASGTAGSSSTEHLDVLEHDEGLGEEALRSAEVRHSMIPRRPLDEDCVRGLLQHGVRRLRRDLRPADEGSAWAEHPVVLTEHVAASSSERRNTAELMFEEFGVPGLLVGRSAELVAIGVGRPTALVVECGAEASTVSVVLDGCVLHRTTQISPLGGIAAARVFSHLVHPKVGQLVPACAGRARCTESYSRMRADSLRRSVFETMARCIEVAGADPPSAEAKKHISYVAPPEQYELPDGRTLKVADGERYHVGELLFGEAGAPPKEWALDAGAGGHVEGTVSLHRMAMLALKATDSEHHKELIRNTVLSGGLSCMKGLPERFESEMRAAAAAAREPTIHNQAHRVSIYVGHTHERQHGAWLGASILGSMGAYPEMWMSASEYEEHGASLITRKGLQMAF